MPLQDRFTSCMEKISSEVRGLPVYGIGHSTGAMLTLLINSRFAVRCDGNILLSYNNRPAQDIIPFLASFVAPGARAVGPLLSQAASNPIGMSMASLYDNAKTMAPSLVKMGLPAFEQISPVFMDVVCFQSPPPFTSLNNTREAGLCSWTALYRLKVDRNGLPAQKKLLSSSEPTTLHLVPC